MEINAEALSFLRSKFDCINFIDVGSAYGGCLDYVRSHHFSKIFSIGIEPRAACGHYRSDAFGERPVINTGYDVFLGCAIDNVTEETDMTFYLNADPQASSLLEMNIEGMTNKLEERDSKIYLEWCAQLSILGTAKVKVKSLKMIMDQYVPDKVHFLKIDAEGKDLDIIKSAGNRISDIYVATLECSSHTNHDIRAFKNGSQKEDVIAFMTEHNFSVFKCVDWGNVEGNFTQVSDIVFINNEIKPKS